MYDPDKVLNFFDRMDRHDRRLSEVVGDIADSLGFQGKLVEKTLILEREDDVILLREERHMDDYSDDEWDAMTEDEQESIRRASKKTSGDNSNTGPFHNRFAESMEAGSIEGNVPENVLEESEPMRTMEVVSGDDVRTIRERIALRKRRNEILREKVESGEEVTPYEVRYKLQDWTNGGQEYDPETNSVKFENSGEASAYERERRKTIDARRRNRLEAERADDDRNRDTYTSTYERNMDRRNKLDGQVDDFLSNYIREYGDGSATPGKLGGKNDPKVEPLKETLGSEDWAICVSCDEPIKKSRSVESLDGKAWVCNECYVTEGYADGDPDWPDYASTMKD